MNDLRIFGTTIGLLGALSSYPPTASAVSCPSGGATLVVKVNNPTTSTPTVTVSGQGVNGYVTCTTGSNTYSQTQALAAGPNVTTQFTFTGLNSGLWQSQIAVSGAYTQYQRVMVLQSPGSTGNPYSTANWSYYPNYVTVSTTGDAASGSCGATCTFRQALASANAATQNAANPFLIVFSASPGAMTSSSVLNVGKSNGTGGWVTVDGTNSAGTPWVVGDALSSADGYSYTIDLANTTQIAINGTNNTIQGLAINNTSSGTPTKSLIVDGATPSNTTIQRVRLDGGAASKASYGGGLCAVSGFCGTNANLIALTAENTVISNVEGRSAYGAGVCLESVPSSGPELRDSWFHHNLDTQLCIATGALTRNFVELGGFRASDNTVLNSDAAGIYGLGTSGLTTSANVIRTNKSQGMALTSTSVGLSLTKDYVCGNGNDGISLNNSSGLPVGSGLTSAYNASNGMSFTGSSGTDPNFENDSAFTANASKSMRNYSGSFNVKAKNNQWRGATGGVTCLASADAPQGSVTCDPVQDYRNVAIALSTTKPVEPSNVIRSGQTVRIHGQGFNAIDANPPAPTPGCTPGPGAGSSMCCNNTAKGNLCDTSYSPPRGVAGKGNCVALKNSNPTPSWVPQNPVSTTPKTITFGLANSFSCIGQQNEKAQVSKLDGLGNVLRDDVGYCTNEAPK